MGIVAQDRMNDVLGKDAEVIDTFPGKELVGRSYEPLFPYFVKDEEGNKRAHAFEVISSDHVTTDNGTGLVHMAPAFGEDDSNACQKIGIKPVDPVDEEGRFTNAVPICQKNEYQKPTREYKRLKDEGTLFAQGTLQHSYPFCWRSGTPLIYKTVPVWFVKVEEIRNQMEAHNKRYIGFPRL